MTKNLRLWLSVVGIFAIFMLTYLEKEVNEPVWTPFESESEFEHEPGYAINVKDENGEVVFMTSHGVSVGDEIINAKGKHYRIEEVKEKEAYAKLLGTDEKLLSYQEYFKNAYVPASLMDNSQEEVIGIYHTHTDESYLPTDGTESIAFDGGIYRVGEHLTQKLENNNIKVEYDKTAHDPHDSNAYSRSRRTAVNLIKNNPVALIDVHRDGIPDPAYYQAQVGNMDIAQLRLVVGRENPNMEANLDFARQMMAYANEANPTVVKEIFLAKGNYNQDLMPTLLLIEAGTYTNTREEALNGVTLFSEAVPTVLGMAAEASETEKGATNEVEKAGNNGAWKALAWIVGIFIVGGFTYLVISAGGVKQAMDKVFHFVRNESGGKK